jgi:hypothetical protein
MAKATRKAADKKSEPKDAAGKKMTKDQAQQIVNRYSGINGPLVPEELKQARKILKEE